MVSGASCMYRSGLRVIEQGAWSTRFHAGGPYCQRTDTEEGVEEGGQALDAQICDLLILLELATIL
jgi:hypothetical protein